MRETESGFWAVYEKDPSVPQLRRRQRAETEDHSVLAWAFQRAITKAREVGWFV